MDWPAHNCGFLPLTMDFQKVENKTLESSPNINNTKFGYQKITTEKAALDGCFPNWAIWETGPGSKRS